MRIVLVASVIILHIALDTRALLRTISNRIKHFQRFDSNVSLNAVDCNHFKYNLQPYTLFMWRQAKESVNTSTCTYLKPPEVLFRRSRAHTEAPSAPPENHLQAIPPLELANSPHRDNQLPERSKCSLK